jgi:hypothetical protein
MLRHPCQRFATSGHIPLAGTQGAGAKKHSKKAEKKQSKHHKIAAINDL